MAILPGGWLLMFSEKCLMGRTRVADIYRICLLLVSIFSGSCQWPQPRHTYLVINNPRQITAFIGDTITLTCEGSFEWEAVEMFWLYNGFPQEDVRPRYSVVELMDPQETVTQNTLTIHRARLMDAGRFTCASKDMHVIDSVYVSVIAEPELRPSPDILLHVGSPFTLACTLHPHVSNADMYWYRHGTLIGTTGTHDFDGDSIPDGRVLSSGELLVYSAQKSDAGDYTCILRYVVNRRLKNVARIINVNANVEVRVDEFIKLNSPPNEPIRITCFAYGYPLPRVTWSYKNVTIGGDSQPWGRRVAITTRKRSPVTVTSDLVISDFPGSFAMAPVRCKARNFFSNASQLSLMMRFGNGTTVLLDGTTLDSNIPNTARYETLPVVATAILQHEDNSALTNRVIGTYQLLFCILAYTFCK